MLMMVSMGRGRSGLVFSKWVLRRSRHLSTGTFVYRDCTSRLASDMLVILVFLSFLRRSPELVMWEGLMVPRRGGENFGYGFCNFMGGTANTGCDGSHGDISFMSFGETV